MTMIAVAGTGTEVGKTYVTAALVRALRARDVPVVARKPVQSFAPGGSETDADVLAAASGEAPTVVCPHHRWLPEPMAPPMAADALGLPPFTVAQLVAETTAGLPGDALALMETAGGVCSPIAVDGDCRALIDALAPALVLLVADAGLGTINLVRLSTAALAGHPVVTFVNRVEPGRDLHRRNVEWLRTQAHLEVVTDLDDLARRVSSRKIHSHGEPFV